MENNERKQALRELIIFYAAKAQALKIAANFAKGKQAAHLLELSEEDSKKALSIADSVRFLGRSSVSGINYLDHLEWSMKKNAKQT